MKSPLVPLGATIIAVGLTVFLMWPARKPKLDPKDYQYIFCPSCQKEWAYKAEQYEQGCQRCGGPLEITKESMKTAGAKPSPYSKMLSVVLLELVVGMGAVVLLAGPRQAAPEIEYLYMRCPNPKCRQKIRYQERQIGHQGACRRCKKPFTFPEADPYAVRSEDAEEAEETS